MRQLVDCIGLSARKKVLESGRTPRSSGALTHAKTKSLRFATHAPLDFGDSGTGTFSGALALALANSDSEAESDGASASTSDAPPSPSPSPAPRPGSAMSMLSRRSSTPVTTQLLQPPRAAPPWDAQAASPPEPSLEGDEDALEVLEGRYRALMGEIASIEGKVGAMRRRTR